MLLKKQTVWLLTMLSLIIVLSVYYITAPGSSDNLAFLQAGKKTASVQKSGKDAAVSGTAKDDVFTALRLQRDENRDALSEEYTSVVASPTASAEVQAEAWNKISQLQSLTMKEMTLETLIKAMGFADAMVNTTDNDVRVIVKANKLTNKQAAAIIQKTQDHLGKDKTVAVEFQSTN